MGWRAWGCPGDLGLFLCSAACVEAWPWFWPWLWLGSGSSSGRGFGSGPGSGCGCGSGSGRGAEGRSGSSRCRCPGLHLWMLSLLPKVPHSGFPRKEAMGSNHLLAEELWHLPAVLPSLWESRGSKSWRCPQLCSMGAPAQPQCVHVSVCPPPVPCPALPSSGVTRHCSRAVGHSLHRHFPLGNQPLLTQICYIRLILKRAPQGRVVLVGPVWPPPLSSSTEFVWGHGHDLCISEPLVTVGPLVVAHWAHRLL